MIQNYLIKSYKKVKGRTKDAETLMSKKDLEQKSQFAKIQKCFLEEFWIKIFLEA